MRIEYHIKIIPYGKMESIYGAVSYIDGKPFDFMIGTHIGTKKEISEKVTKLLLERNKSKLRYNSYVFKYEDLHLTKEINYKFKNDKFYQEYSKMNKTELFAAPSVFLSDKNKELILQQKMNTYIMCRDYIKQRGGK